MRTKKEIYILIEELKAQQNMCEFFDQVYHSLQARINVLEWVIEE